MKKRQLLKEAFIASVLVIAADLLISFFPFKFELLRPIKQGFNDFDVYDLRYTGSHSFSNTTDTSITIVGIGNNRSEIAEQINTIDSLGARIIGVDAIFSRPGQDESADLALTRAVKKAKNIVLASGYAGKTATGADSINKSFFEAELSTPEDGLYNFLEGPEEIKRHFIPFFPVGGQRYPAFASALLRHAFPEQFAVLENRGNEIETINYSGNAGYFNVVTLEKYKRYRDRGELVDLLKNKVVLLGFINEEKPLLMEDIHFTPLNEKFAGKSFPDMYGVVIHANIIEMALKGKYIAEMPGWLAYLITFVLVFAINIFYIRMQSKKGKHHHFLIFLFQFVMAVLLIYFALLFFSAANVKIDISPIVIAVVLSFEIFWLYEWVALKMHKLYRYETFLAV